MKRKGWNRLVEFFEADHGQLSMTRLLCFLSFWPASYCVVRSASSNTAGEVLGWFLGAYVLGYVGGKIADTKNEKGAVDGKPSVETAGE